ncbi:hypothetical protein P43SY_002970 [Pythium insidiosum]|uniref:5'-3' DNA helicase ZGRF1-like N-terminal domain-containing protein n=1 Tax=Pythium insidiosum TaxID=114742 RepID=A0AAD5LBH7_PYTIN|nr:hypothetical protein P43SY_002970 [Pythium insidiosum]
MGYSNTEPFAALVISNRTATTAAEWQYLMVKLRHLLGDAPVTYYECMYTKHKTQKRKTWHDGFLALHASRRAVLHEEEPPDGKVLDESKYTHNEWDLKNYDEYIPFAKFLVEVVNETPLKIGSDSASVAAPPAIVDQHEVQESRRELGVDHRDAGAATADEVLAIWQRALSKPA